MIVLSPGGRDVAGRADHRHLQQRLGLLIGAPPPPPRAHGCWLRQEEEEGEFGERERERVK